MAPKCEKAKCGIKNSSPILMEQKGVVAIEGRKADDALFEGSLMLCQFELLSG